MATVMVMGMAMVMVQTVLDQGPAACAARGLRRQTLALDGDALLAWGRRALRRPGFVSPLVIALACAAGPVQAANWTIQPSIQVRETLTDNLYLSSSSDKTGDLVTGITPGISIKGEGSRAKLRLAYGYTEQLYLRESNQRNSQNSLRAIGALEAVEDFFFIDATGTISQQYLSAFGAVSPSTANVNNNQTETSNYSLSPYVRGTMLGWVDYLVRYRRSTTSSQSNLASDYDASEWTGVIDGSTRWSRITWALDASHVQNTYSRGRDTDGSHYGITLSYRFNPQFQVSLLGGRESNDYVTLDQETNYTRGFGVDWTPDLRTQLAAKVRNRFFGTGYDVNFRHRMRRSLVTFLASRDVTSQPSGVSNTGMGSNYDASYALIAANNPELSPSEIEAQVTEALQSRGLPADGTAVNGYLTDRQQVQELQRLSFAMLGARNTVTLTATRSEQQPLGLVNGVTNDFSLPDRVLQQGVSISWGHKLTGLSSLSLSLSQQRSTGYTAGSPETETQYANLLFSTRIGPNTNANVGARRVISSGVTGYTESALTAALLHSF